MTLELRWNPSFSASALHAAARLRTGRTLLDAQLAEALREPTRGVARAAQQLGLSDDKFWLHVVPLAAQIENNRQLAQRVGRRLLGAERSNASAEVLLAGAISDLESAYRRAVPDIEQQLRLRIGPLRDLCEARGPGLFRLLSERTEPGLIVESAEVILVQPVCGGGGVAHLPYNSATIEGVLANPVAELPETVRLGWLLAQLNCDLPAYSQNLPQMRLPVLAALALIPPVLAAAEELELVRFDPATLALALETWELAVENRATVATTLWQWFEVYRQGGTSWRTALEALHQLIPASG